MTHFIKKGKTFTLQSKEALDIHETLPIGTYTVGFSSCSGQFYLEKIDNFEINHKLYGDTTKHAERIMNTFLDRKEASTGVLLSGEKGSGKTLLAKMLSIKAREDEGIPTLVVNQEFSGEGFNTFLQMIEQPTVVLFDEYEKVYKPGQQEKLLTLLDGIYPSQKLFLLTCNDKWRVNENMRNRPGRIYYTLDFDGLGPSFIRDYCKDNLQNKDNIEKVVTISGVFRAFNFDMLKGMVEEMNRYDETPAQVLKFLNARPAFELKQISYMVKLKEADKEGKIFSGRKDGLNDFSGNPLKQEVVVYYQKKTDDAKRPRKQVLERFNANDLVGLNNDTGAYIFKNKKGVTIVLTPRKTEFEVQFDRLPALRTPYNKKRAVSPTEGSDKMIEDGSPDEDEHAWAMESAEDEGDYGDY
ncbi:expressed unknown protein [Seminavis robusta]|uniref:AAA+ ATPase domain-containing protein n=1 Tax=Seminavis robusta TaxID=568900 RepID=A0A9N8H9I4_9STRA|nr:expressed unknown protein [Seminavis robusta]|eukprot:Sro207_g086810.1 n/a (412) ;mRNA; f:32886-34289